MLTHAAYGLTLVPVIVGLFIAARWVPFPGSAIPDPTNPCTVPVCSRVYDHKHSPADICAGAIVGALIAGLMFMRIMALDNHRLYHLRK